ncbi:hypothetical protein OSB04_005956 [Centaurea solstitialis]|uniref:Uncharacterized protein n=1 Tax=Centaurea solstitialis TaxID=347529 RepID=A0AA38WSD9_9ASTR|nr:hypothetical protein OSB04_005956 [Centaurea solstitialis]
MELVDPRLGTDYNVQEVMVVINLALLCTTISPTERPAMSAVVSMLEGRTISQAFVVEQSVSKIEVGPQKMVKQVESVNESRVDEMSILQTDSFTNVVDLYPVTSISEYLKKRDNHGEEFVILERLVCFVSYH